MEQHGFDFALTERVPSRNLADRIEEPVSANENISGLGLFAPKELAENHAKLNIIDVGSQLVIGHIALDFIEGYRCHGCTLRRCEELHSLQGQVSCDLAEERHEVIGTGRRNPVPCAEICIADTFFRVLVVFEYVVGYSKTELAVFGIRLFDGVFVALKVQFNDLQIFHVFTSLI